MCGKCVVKEDNATRLPMVNLAFSSGKSVVYAAFTTHFPLGNLGVTRSAAGDLLAVHPCMALTHLVNWSVDSSLAPACLSKKDVIRYLTQRVLTTLGSSSTPS